MGKLGSKTDLSFWNGKRVLITGHTGFKGSWLCILLNKLEANVSGYALNPPTEPSLFVEAEVEKSITSYIGDVRDYEKFLEVIQKSQPEIVIHMAAQPLVRDSYKIPIDTYAINVMGTVHVLEACRNTPSVKSIVNVTTDKCYENKEWYWGYRENEPMGGYDPYSNSKGCSELVTSSYRSSYFNPKDYDQHGVALASARAGNVIGGGDWANDRLIPDFIKAIAKGEKIKIRSPYAIRPWQHVLEPLSGYILLAEKLYNDGVDYAEGWNFGPEDSDAKNVEWIISKICALWGEDSSYEIDNLNKLHEANYLKLDCSKAKSKLDWNPRWDIETTLKLIVDWNKAYLNSDDIRKRTEEEINQYFQL
ncbi:CDP-glucose 4,6-dehydratase [Aquimarina aquimarini]|uniref:CDP-glucose 4,6-dehydratase n=1 Tax=Aquimarina aquimarini TaxID=1191734 RepID=UPI000D5583CE|nr:CDP-glucose 4,6-dehydratase [Aquimarina aquimarini]